MLLGQIAGITAAWFRYCRQEEDSESRTAGRKLVITWRTG
jgi:hypothetical protein